jgi:hypothetical protein
MLRVGLSLKLNLAAAIFFAAWGESEAHADQMSESTRVVCKSADLLRSEFEMLGSTKSGVDHIQGSKQSIC